MSTDLSGVEGVPQWMFWGAPFWRFIHFFALHDQRDLVLQLKNFIPCGKCKSEWYDPSPEENLLDWSREFHNKVNAKLGRYDKWDARDLSITHKPTCDICENQEQIHRFPLDFINVITPQPNALNFLKTFNATYPCDVHRGTFFDDPQPEESTVDWVIRNNKRRDPNFVAPLYVSYFQPNTDQPPTTCSGCSTQQVEIPVDQLPATITVSQTVDVSNQTS